MHAFFLLFRYKNKSKVQETIRNIRRYCVVSLPRLTLDTHMEYEFSTTPILVNESQNNITHTLCKIKFNLIIEGLQCHLLEVI